MAELFISRPVLTPSLLRRCSCGGGDEYWHCKHRYGIWSKYGRWIFLQSFRYFVFLLLPFSFFFFNLARIAFYHLFELGYLSRLSWSQPEAIFPIFLKHITSFPLPRLRICCSGVLLHLNSKHTLTGALGRTAQPCVFGVCLIRARARVCVWVCGCVRECPSFGGVG